MDDGELGGGRRGDHRARQARLGIRVRRITPPLVETCHRARAAIGAVNVEGLLRPLLRSVPLVVAVSGNQATALGECGAERRLLGDCLDPCVGQLGSDRRLLRPRRDQSPACDLHSANEGSLALPRGHEIQLLSRCDVEVGCEHPLRRIVDFELLDPVSGGRGCRVSPAHQSSA